MWKSSRYMSCCLRPLVHNTICYQYYILLCSCLNAVFHKLVSVHSVKMLVLHSHLLSPSSPSFAHWCLSCSALPHPPTSGFIPFGAPFTPGPFMFSAVPVPPPPGVNIEEHLQIRQEEKRQRINRRHRLEEGRGMAQKMEKNAVWK